MFRKSNFVKRLYGAANASTEIATVAETSTRVSMHMPESIVSIFL